MVWGLLPARFQATWKLLAPDERNIGLEPHPLLGRQALYQLSYISLIEPLKGLEPPATGLEDQRSSN